MKVISETYIRNFSSSKYNIEKNKEEESINIE